MKKIQLGLISFAFLIILAFAVSAETCYDSVKDIPATCEGAAISSDTWNGGRTITCGDLRIAAWDKTGYFEMYKQAGGSSVKLCIGSTCIKENGYAKSADFPICVASNQTNNTCTPSNEVCDQQDNDCDGLIDEGNVCGTPPPSNQTCYANVNDLPVTCTGGTVTTDNKAGCRTVICTSGPSSMQAMACDKPTSSSPTFYEVYHQGKTGTAVSKICFGAACVDGSGYARADFPYCAASNDTLPTYCSYNGVNYTLGQSFPAGDGCNTCTCGSNGHVMCTQQACGPGNQTNETNTTACYGKVNDIPATCDGGTITTDEKGGCRKIVCSTSGSSMQVLACDKSGFFEMYRQTTVGSGVKKVCIGPTCIQNEGYAKSPNYPICMSNQTNTTPPNTTNTTNTSDPGANSTLSLVSGTVNGQSISPSQRVVTAAPGAAISGAVQLAYSNAWPSGISVPLGATRTWNDQSTGFQSFGDATGSGKTVNINFTAPTFQGDYAIIFAYRAETTTAHVFSMTNWVREPAWYDGNDIAQWSGSMINTANSQGRVNGSVLFNDGYRSAMVPATAIIVRVSTTPPNTSGATVSIVPDGTAEHNVVFRCEPGFNATQFRWTFSDGTSFNKTNSSGYQRMETYPNVYHTFPGNGTYTATCTATDGNRTTSGSTQVTISTRATPAQIAETPIFNIMNATHVSGNTFSVSCDAVGAKIKGADWHFYGNGLTYWPNNYPTTISFTFSEQKNYSVHCQSGVEFNATPEYHNTGYRYSGCSAPYMCSYADSVADSSMNITVPYTDDVNLHGGLYAEQVGPMEYEFWCNIPSWPDGSYYYDFGDGTQLWGRPEYINHAYAQPGNYSARCEYRISGGYGGAQGGWSPGTTVQVGGNTTPNTTAPVCFTTVQELNASCKDSNLVSEQYVNGCMEYVCQSGTGRIKVKACDKPTASYHPYYFEMYKTEKSGYGPNFCLGETCFQNSDYARSEIYPACLLAPDDDGWNEYMAGWSYNNGIYSTVNTQADVPVESYYAEGRPWDDYTVQVDMFTKSGYTPADSQLLVRYQNESHFGACAIMQWNGTWLQLRDGYRSWDGTAPGGVIAEKQFPFNNNQWYTIKASVIGNQLTCEVVGYPETRLTGTWSGPSTGTVGLRGTHMPVDYRNMVVEFA